MPTRAPLPTPPPPTRRPAWRWLRRRFGFSRAETSGLVVLLAVAALLGLGLPLLLQPTAPAYLPAADQRQLDAWASALGARLDSARAAAPTYAGRYQRRAGAASRFPAVPQVQLAPFNPNALSALDWEARGVPHFVAGRIVNYGQKAGGFRAKSQLQRIYGLPDSVYQRLAPFMQLPEALPGRGERPTAGGTLPAYAATAPASRFPRKPAHLAAFDLNLADTTQLRQIKGIGQGRAKWIVKRREELGGFVSEDQLREVFVLRDAPDLVDSLRKYTFVAPGFAPRPVHINSGSFDELYLHPYVRKNLARLIVAFRNQHGPYKTPDDLQQIKLLKPADFEQLRPYVRCD
ncbi:helix-hairpin-helix domain-containing protein [Hymenobacter sp. RP-2-7]|uniref:Helix-hairpin-helix domain-containing protein n=1 Tax=Hymenobacter polaris TaxID=2682546 RepID=A0A7Y0AF05_9BACT|nr:helix-hairpin-helix domain-containing protein [Hymenobacter polaris]NML65870.1 helix-hairpin-helix domain-containing protein [Hymenobacter polaris]